MRINLIVLALTVLMLAVSSAWAAPITDTFDACIDPNGGVEGSGSGYDNGTWFEYPSTGWWNIWFYNAPYDPDRWKEISLVIDLVPNDPGAPWDIEIALNWSTPCWSDLGLARPPLPENVPTVDLEELYIARLPFYNVASPDSLGNTNNGKTLTFEHIIPDYNPEWVSIDIRGTNVCLTGTIVHECVPEPASLALLGFGVMAMLRRRRN